MVRRWTWILGLVVGLIVPSGVAAAAPQTQGITISPATVQPVLGATQPQTSFDLSLTNHTPTTQNLSLSTVDFGTLDETGGLFLIGQPNTFERQHGLAAWMSLSQPTLTIAPGQTTIDKVTVTNNSSLISGGHYGAVLIKTTTNQPAGDQARVDFKPIITELIFLNKTGGDRFSLNLAGVQKPSGWGGLPKQIKLRFQATGNVHVTPRGIVSIIDPAGREVSRGIINEDSDLVLPGAYRQIETAMHAERAVVLPGPYQLVVDYRYDGQDGYTRVAYNFELLNLPLLIGWPVGLLVLGGVIVFAWRKLRPKIQPKARWEKLRGRIRSRRKPKR